MPDDPLAVIAESYQGIHESTRVIAQATVQMRDTQARVVLVQAMTLRLQVYALTLIGLTVLLLGFLGWQHLVYQHATTHLQQKVLRNTQTIAAQTKALLERQP